MADFVHLHVHSEYSLLDGLSKIPKLVSQAKIMGMNSLAITDHGALYGAIKFFKECKKEEVNPIIGCEIYIAKRSMRDKEAPIDKENYHLTVLASDFEGYRNLMKLVTMAQLEGFYYRPRVDKETLAKHAKGLIALSGCSSSEFAKAIIDSDKAQKIAKTYQQIFGKNNFYLEIQRHLFDQFMTAHEAGSEIHSELNRMGQEEKKLIEGSKKVSHELSIGLVATNDVHYVAEQDAPAQDAIVCIQTGKTIAETKRLRMVDSPTFYLKSSDEMVNLFEDLPEAIKNTVQIAQRVKIEIPLAQVAFPNYPVPDKISADVYLKRLCEAGIKKRFDKLTAEIKQRLDYELSVIATKRYSTYFLVVSDFVNWAREQGIISTTRGSVSGSLVSYALGITTVNPLFFKLPFERFLNLYRPTLPDIDVDFADNRRDQVIEYVRRKYGLDKVVQIGTFGTMMARSAVRDVARVLGWPYIKADRIAKMIPIGAQGFHMSLDTAKKQNRELGELYEKDKEIRELLDLAEKVEGNARHVSVHAAGVVISPDDITNYTPLQREASGEKIITQYDMYDVEEVGLVKMDFLGIRNLSILGSAIAIVSETQHQEIDLSDIPLDDKKAFELLSRGQTIGLFQLGGSGMTRYLKELRPSNIFDIMAMISLFRPGPMNSIPEFIKRKHDAKSVTYFDPRMADYLKESYGLIVYQDDVLLTAINIAGYTWEEADKFRKAMGKKIPAEMTRQKEKFIAGCVKNAMKAEKAEELFKLIEPFAAYGFNKAHAASYAVIAYQTAYMKANYPVEFMAAVMSAESDDPDKISSAVSECAKMNITVLPPDVNFSQTGFTIEDIDSKKGIRFGLSAIKNVGAAAIEAIISERKSRDSFESIDDFLRRVNLRVVNRKTLESLIKAGAMDRFGKRNPMLKILAEIKSSGSTLTKTIATGQGTLFDEAELEMHSSVNQMIKMTLDSIEEAPREEILSWERELLGFYLTEHPLAKLADKIATVTSGKIAEVLSAERENSVIIGGIIAGMRKTLTKVRKEEMCFARLQDETGSIEVIVFPKVYSLSKNILGPDRIVVISGHLEISEENQVLIADKVSTLEEIAQNVTSPKTIEVSLPKDADRVLLSQIYQVLKANRGETPTYLVLPNNNGSPKRFPVPFGSKKTHQLVSQLKVLGCEVVDD